MTEDDRLVGLRQRHLSAYRECQTLRAEILAIHEPSWSITQREAQLSDIVAELDDVADWHAVEIPARRWLVEDWLPIGEASLLTGAGAVGKSLLAEQLVMCVAAGTPFLGLGVTQAPAVYISCEDGPEEIARRAQAIGQVDGIRLADLRGRCFFKSWRGETMNELVTFDRDRAMTATPRFDALKAAVMATGARLVVLDNTSHLFGGEENTKREVAGFCNLLNGLASEIDGVVLLLGHPNKTGVNNPDMVGNQFGGSVAWENQMRSRLFIAASDDDADARELTSPKANYSARGSKIAFRWHEGAFTTRKDLPASAAREIAATIAASADNATFLRCLAKATTNKRAVSHVNGTNYAPRIFANMVEAKGAKALALAAAMERLLHLGTIRLDEQLWQDGHRHWKRGMKLAAECGDPPASTPCGDPRRPPTQVIDNTAATMCGTTPLYTTYKEGPALVAAPFSSDTIEDPNRRQEAAA